MCGLARTRSSAPASGFLAGTSRADDSTFSFFSWGRCERADSCIRPFDGLGFRRR